MDKEAIHLQKLELFLVFILRSTPISKILDYTLTFLGSTVKMLGVHMIGLHEQKNLYFDNS